MQKPYLMIVIISMQFHLGQGRQYFDSPRKGKGRVRHQVNAELAGFHKGDIVKVKGKYVRRVRTIYSRGSLGFYEEKPGDSVPKYCRLLQKATTIIWNRV